MKILWSLLLVLMLIKMNEEDCSVLLKAWIVSSKLSINVHLSNHKLVFPCTHPSIPAILQLCLLSSSSKLFTCLFLDCFPILCCSRNSISPQGSLKFHLIHLSDHPSIHPSVHTTSQVRFYLSNTLHLTVVNLNYHLCLHASHHTICHSIQLYICYSVWCPLHIN